MAKKTLEMELKVGFFVSIGLGLLMMAIFMLGGADSFFTRYQRYSVHYPSVEGLIPGAKVMLGGVTVGTVDELNFDPKTRDIRIGLKVGRTYGEWIRSDTEAEIATQGVLGDKFIALTTGSQDAALLESGSVIKSRPIRDFSQFLGKGDQLMITLNKIASSLERVLHSFEAGNRSETFFQGMATTSKNLASATDRLNKELDQIRIKSAINHLDGILAKIDNGTGTLGALVNDPQLYYDTRALMGGANRNRIVRNLVRKTIKDAEEEDAAEKEDKKP